MKSIVELWQACLYEAGEQCRVRVQRDLAYAMSRVEEEGLGFLTITLPRYEKDLLNAVSIGRVESNHFAGFRRSGGLPAFLRGFLSQIFDKDGFIRNDADPMALRAVRQVLLLVSKIELPVSKRRERKAIAAYVRTDNCLVELSDRQRAIFRSAARSLLGEYLSEVESKLWSRDWIPRHSSGALATRETPNGRWSNVTWTERLQDVLPWWDDLTTCPSEIQSSEVSVLSRDEETPARLALVPKTMKGPRIIVMEPAPLQFVQQGIFHLMSETLRKGKHRVLHEAFSWDSQEPNRELARFGSIDGSYATVDLSEASDRVSLGLVEDLLDSVPYLRSAIWASRSESVRLPNGDVHVLNKFASMGSSLCFPIESMVFFVIASIALAESRDIAPSVLRTTLKFGGVRVYGDDIVIPQIAAQNLVYWLEAYGLKVNVDKTFTTGLFRESCGSDWFQGRDVSVFKMRAPFPTRDRHFELLRSTIEFHNRAYEAGWFLVAEYVAGVCDKHRKRIPRVPVGLDTTAIWSYDGPYVVRTHPTLHRPEYKTLVFREVVPLDGLSGYGALKKSLTALSLKTEDFGDQPKVGEHLERSGRSRCVGIYNGWMVGA